MISHLMGDAGGTQVKDAATIALINYDDLISK